MNILEIILCLVFLLESVRVTCEQATKWINTNEPFEALHAIDKCATVGQTLTVGLTHPGEYFPNQDF